MGQYSIGSYDTGTNVPWLDLGVGREEDEAIG